MLDADINLRAGGGDLWAGGGKTFLVNAGLENRNLLH